MSNSPKSVVDRWVTLEAGKDFPDFPVGWSTDHWMILIRDHPAMHFWVAQQPAAPELAVRTLAASADPRVRWRVAMKRSLPVDLFTTMASDSDVSVRKAIASNAKAPLSLVEALVQDADEDVARVAAYNLDLRHPAGIEVPNQP